MQEILYYLPLLGITVASNILIGVFYNVNILELKFSWSILINGIFKAILVSGVFIGLAYVFDQLPSLTEAIGIEPKFVIVSAITLYAGKSLIGLANVLGIDTNIIV